MKITLERLTNRLYMAEERRLIDRNYPVWRTEKRMTEKNEQSFRDQEDNIKHGCLEAEKWTEKNNGKKWPTSSRI